MSRASWKSGKGVIMFKKRAGVRERYGIVRAEFDIFSAS